MNRRRFLHLLTMAAATAVSPYWTPTPELVEPLPPPPVYSGDPWAGMLVDPKAGVSMRFIRSFDAMHVTRIDVLYGFGTITHPEWGIRVTDKRPGARARRRQKRQQGTPTIQIHPAIYESTVKGLNV